MYIIICPIYKVTKGLQRSKSAKKQERKEARAQRSESTKKRECKEVEAERHNISKKNREHKEAGAERSGSAKLEAQKAGTQKKWKRK